MKKQCKMMIAILLAVIITVGSITPVMAHEITTPATGYTSASDVEYKYHGKYISNWGARGEDCTFLSPNALAYYKGNYSYDVLSGNQGGTSQSNAPSSELYKELKAMMIKEHTHETNYGETRDLYKYTDCLLNDTAHISSFYSGKELNGKWDSAATWNREHTWPNSKGLGGSDEDDIMMLRPTWVAENSSRGNTAYGESSSYFDPGESVRGDCARILLYVYVRWGNTSKMWGTGGVMENKDILLKWMEEDPVDTWEMGRNDAVESITGVRNVFVDYPEYAFTLFGEDIPNDMSTPSGIAKGGSGNNNGGNNDSGNNNNNNDNTNNNDSTNNNNSGSNDNSNTNNNNSSNNNTNNNTNNNSNTNNNTNNNTNKPGCTHSSSNLVNQKEPTCTEDGYDGDMVCKSCGAKVQEGQVIPSIGHHTFGDWTVVEEATDTTDGKKERICSECDYKEEETIPATGTEDNTNSEEEESQIPDTEGGNSGDDSSDKKGTKNPWIVGTAIVVPSGGVIGVITAILVKRRARGK